ncbi:3,4-dihydroxy-2-butanone-4-phosphate synthase [Nocardia sp. NPDC059177]|uniref:3,4-dihydroxy-2-butanone-4-phosphate synthase n=1 Tax=Nocardia sp. NPDC059177 TaxID=3346759 RepID=UPI0036C7CFCE
MSEPRAETGHQAVSAALTALRAGRVILLADAAADGVRGHLMLAAEHVTAAAITLVGGLGCGLVQVALPAAVLDGFGVPPADPAGTGPDRSRYRVSVALTGAGGVRASQRAATVRALATAAAADFARPGHVFPLGTVVGGVLARPEIPEAAVDLAELAGLRPAGVLCEITGADGEWPTWPELTELGRANRFPVVTVAELIAYRRRELCRVTRHGAARIPVPHGEFRAIGFTDGLDREHVAFVHGDPAAATAPLVRLHFECLVGDVLGSRACGCRDALHDALARIAEAGCGALIYVRAGRTAIGDTLRSRGHDADCAPPQAHPVGHSDLQSAFDILDDLGIREIRLLTEPGETHAVPAHLRVAARIPLSAVAAGRTERAS